MWLADGGSCTVIEAAISGCARRQSREPPRAVESRARGQGLAVHCVGQQNLRRHRLRHRDRCAITEAALVRHLDLVAGLEGDMQGRVLVRTDGAENVGQSNSRPGGVANGAWCPGVARGRAHLCMSARRLPAHCMTAVTVCSAKRCRSSGTDEAAAWRHGRSRAAGGPPESSCGMSPWLRT